MSQNRRRFGVDKIFKRNKNDHRPTKRTIPKKSK